MWESGTPIGATGTDTALNFHVYLSLLSSRVSVCRRELDFRCLVLFHASPSRCTVELLEVRRKQNYLPLYNEFLEFYVIRLICSRYAQY